MCTYTHSVMMKEFFQYELDNFIHPLIESGAHTPYIYAIESYFQARIKELEDDCRKKEKTMRRGGNAS